MKILANLKDLTSKSNYKKISLNFFFSFFLVFISQTGCYDHVV